jgi:hypothetical protein
MLGLMTQWWENHTGICSQGASSQIKEISVNAELMFTARATKKNALFWDDIPNEFHLVRKLGIASDCLDRAVRRMRTWGGWLHLGSQCRPSLGFCLNLKSNKNPLEGFRKGLVVTYGFSIFNQFFFFTVKAVSMNFSITLSYAAYCDIKWQKSHLPT